MAQAAPPADPAPAGPGRTGRAGPGRTGAAAEFLGRSAELASGGMLQVATVVRAGPRRDLGLARPVGMPSLLRSWPAASARWSHSAGASARPGGWRWPRCRSGCAARRCRPPRASGPVSGHRKCTASCPSGDVWPGPPAAPDRRRLAAPSSSRAWPAPCCPPATPRCWCWMTSSGATRTPWPGCSSCCAWARMIRCWWWRPPGGTRMDSDAQAQPERCGYLAGPAGPVQPEALSLAPAGTAGSVPAWPARCWAGKLGDRPGRPALRGDRRLTAVRHRQSRKACSRFTRQPARALGQPRPADPAVAAAHGSCRPGPQCRAVLLAGSASRFRRPARSRSWPP